ncbi:GNAT family N-acetyltransferase [Paenibacillus sp. NPDC058071]|uniref:GNAT family N-acetyltransferase n=1 Tax=Paenibacillus sp. NPDC058071 TaxID=3346326 RepID=UPI0036DBD0B8
MIRARHPRTDDAEIFNLIRKELIPLSHTAHPLDARLVRELPIRFRTGRTYVAAPGKTEKPYGFVRFEIMEPVLFIDMLVVRADQRNRDWGKKLMASSEACGLAHRCKAAKLYVDDVNGKAMRFYSRLGYKPVRYYSDLRCYEMVKPLAPPPTSAQ